MHVYININMVHALSPLGSSVRGTKGGWNLREQTWQFISGVNMQTCPKANHMMQSLSQFNFLSSNSATKTFSTCCITHMHHRAKKTLHTGLFLSHVWARKIPQPAGPLAVCKTPFSMNCAKMNVYIINLFCLTCMFCFRRSPMKIWHGPSQIYDT